ncbi:MAG: hypothetical protein PHF37_09885 [Phycisphaerae bacterium]|nr:hypothetical protein [Phycisphaerae bacterium]
MQNLIAISPAKFELQLPMFDNRALINLYRELAQWKRDNGDKIGKELPMDLLPDILRKEAMIEFELESRGVIKKYGPEAKDFERFYKKIHTGLKRSNRFYMGGGKR